MFQLNSALSQLEYQIPQNFSLALTFFLSGSSSLSLIFIEEDKGHKCNSLKTTD